MSGHEFKITVADHYTPEKGDAFDAVVAAIDFFEIPACISSNPDGSFRVGVDPDWEPPELPESTPEEPNTCFDAIVAALEHFYIPAVIVELKPEAGPQEPSPRPPGGPRNAGFVLLEFMLVVGLASLAIIFMVEKQMRDLEISRASLLGQEIATYNTGVRARMIAEPGLTPGPYTGTAWLKSGACGGTAPEDYVPCNLPDATTFGGLTYATNVAVSGSDLEATTVMPALQLGGTVRADLAGYVALDALKRSTDDGVYYSYASDPATAVITMTATTAAGAAGPEYLRTDGGNTMNADITFNNAFAERDINNARYIYTESLSATAGVFATDVHATNNVFTQHTFATGVVSGAYVHSSGNLGVSGAVDVMGDINSHAGNITAQGLMGARDLWLNDIGQWASKAVYSVNMANSSDNADGSLGAPYGKIACPSGLVAKAFWIPSGTAGTGVGYGASASPIHAIWPAVHDWGSAWYLRTWVLTSQGWSVLPTWHGRGVLIQKCT